MVQTNRVTLAKLQEDIHKTLKLWRNPGPDDTPLDYLLEVQQAQQEGSDVWQATNDLLLEALDTLETEADEGARLLRLRFLERTPVHQVAAHLNVADITVHRLQKAAIEQLAKIIHSREEQVRARHRVHLESRLEPPTYDRLIGVEDHLTRLLERLTDPGGPGLVSIEGLGGIGKTSLADALARRAISEDLFDELGWVSARQQILRLGGGIKPLDRPALTAEDLIEKLREQLLAPSSRPDPFLVGEARTALRLRLKQRRGLIVVDNLETAADVESLLPTLRHLANPTRFLLTTRESLHYESGLFHFRLPGLSQADALHLIRHEAHLHNLPYLEQAADEELRPIFETVGGNPLALRLVVGQAHVHPLPTILNDVAAARGQAVERLYTYIYRQDWEYLDETARRVLLAMPLAPDQGSSLEYLTGVTGLEQAALTTALNELVKLNLVDSIGGLTERRYSIHNLTRSFLQTQVALWS